MAVENLYGSIALDGYYDPTTPPAEKGDAAAMAGRVRCAVETVEVTAAASATSTYTLAKLPSNARLLPQSTLYWDDLASTGSPTVDVGLFPVNANITADDDALGADKDVTSAGSSGLIDNIANYGKKLWQYVSGQTADPGGEFLVKVTIKDADTNTGGTLTLVLFYTTT